MKEPDAEMLERIEKIAKLADDMVVAFKNEKKLPFLTWVMKCDATTEKLRRELAKDSGVT